MSNSATERTRRQRQAAAAKWQKEKLAAGQIAQMNLRADAATIEEFKAVLAEIGGSRPDALRRLCAIYRNR